MAELVFQRGGEQLLRLPIDRDRLRLGRGPENDLVLPAEDIAREQAVLELREGVWWLVDRAGRGTRLDEEDVREEAPLGHGSLIGLGGEWSAVLRLEAPTSPGETRRAASGGTRVRLAEGGRVASQRLSWTAAGVQRRLGLGEEAVSIGTDPANAVALDDPYASAFHARLVPREGRWTLRDLGSTNGTTVGGVRVTEAVLAPGSTLRIGETDLLLEADAPDLALPSHGILTGDQTFRELIVQICRIAESEATVTIFGESGTGKELVARLVHDESGRRGPFIPVNCAAISKELIESELFGHEKGAFTGAANFRRGAFEEASGGTLFLDEVGELPLDLQAKLLRAIELREIRRVGSSRPIQVDVRIVAATNRDLHAEVRAGRFREDLFYRLFVVPVTLPPLRRRQGDVMRLIEHFLRTRGLRRVVPPLTQAARDKLLAHPWPGNVRELRNAIERALLTYRGEEIEAKDITFAEPLSVAPEEGVIHAVGKSLKEIEREAIVIALKAHAGNRRLSAESLGMARSTLQVRLKEFGIVTEADPEES